MISVGLATLEVAILLQYRSAYSQHEHIYASAEDLNVDSRNHVCSRAYGQAKTAAKNLALSQGKSKAQALKKGVEAGKKAWRKASIEFDKRMGTA